MLEIKNLSKTYKPKKGVPVTALKNINLKLSDTGMIFLLGKSGSGKSTLLNLLGGLDRYDGGEIIINGVSSKDFKQSHFDSYRNTYVGFIFQEYNILNEFNVGENIAIALELQGQRATDERINYILNQVDLDGYGNRKPNELSGGQKQRVAIARALVKNPEIIMADEPTGALDSNTGKQVLDTLKKLSLEKLIIVVSHDRDFAENYADRIIELADGEVINDITVDKKSSTDDSKENLEFNENTITINNGYHLSENDLDRINRYIDSIKNDSLKITIKEQKINTFSATDEGKIIADKSKSFRLIKSKLPLRNAFRMGAGGLKYKKFRLVITVLLSCVAFGLFGLADTLAAYNHIKVCTNSIYDSNIDYAAVVKSRQYGERWYDYNNRLSQDDLIQIKSDTGVSLNGVFVPRGSDLSFSLNVNPDIKTSESEHEIFQTYFSGYTEITDKKLKNFGYSLVAGRLPDGSKNEIAISDYIFEVFKKTQYTDGTLGKDSKGNDVVIYEDIKQYDDLLNRLITINNTKYTVVGIVDTKFDLSRYESLIEKKDYQSSAQQIIDYALINEFYAHKDNSLVSMIMVGSGFVEKIVKAEPVIFDINKGYLWFHGDEFNIDPSYLTTLDEIDLSDVVWISDSKKALNDKEIIVFESCVDFWNSENAVYTDNGQIDYAKTLGRNNKTTISKNMFEDEKFFDEEGYTVVGVLPNNEKYSKFDRTAIVSEALLKEFVSDDDGIYTSAIGVMPKQKDSIKTLVSFCYNNDDDIRFPLQNAATFELDMISEELKEFAKIFMYIGLGFALFAAVMMANFIGTSISYKKQEIGILRAIGSRSNDVFRIFFSESFIIAIINFILSGIGVFLVTQIINGIVRKEVGILITFLTFGARQIVLILFISVFVAFVASFVPVYRIASKKPIDAIRDK
ncbi:MAG: ABC transporter ATP-binding protein/permease [Ruminococcaceae bacterium]|nr:ABC transporter ATP-binding protein/permease [Oscillospiraceae bacterium]